MKALPGSIHLLEIELHLYMLTRHVSLGKQDNRFNVVFVEQHLAVCFSVIIYTEFKSD